MPIVWVTGNSSTRLGALVASHHNGFFDVMVPYFGTFKVGVDDLHIPRFAQVKAFNDYMNLDTFFMACAGEMHRVIPRSRP